ncbi:AT-hook motif nuclear-localized protein 10 [Salvia miltiorrhiza]|uniref:AT-hook motif nuclear-localized protein 10 n=1 Tax=Salvia miltiorrhiza TaxID=226208 RepID=UPI0025ACB2B1|nr:AT-hook motif nuclear-localized protein 10 [Salvia miltiorrhiza]XP_057776429.1 AT-hook motif nuclear-localized protein 10 [Salvia miltiorrhiza]XP_057776438.1 AT-hook motif nuclear-localized protein 10 [Salvia miltiorrhiza]
MSGVSEASAAVMSNREPFTITPAQHPSASQPQLDQQMRVPYAAEGAYRAVGASPPFQPDPCGGVAKQGMNLSSGDQKRKRGRPRKYGTDGSMAMVMASGPQPISVGLPQTDNFSPPSAPPLAEAQHPVGGSASPTAKKPRGRPPGSSNKKKQIEAIGSTGIGFIPHVINVKAGEDVSSKVMAFSQNGPRAVCILSANGAISNVTLRQAATSGGTATYEGRFDILSLSGSFMLSDVGGHKSRTGGLSTTLSGPDGRVFGGCVAGLLIAASPVQVIVGSFLADGRKEPKPAAANYMEPLSAPPKVNMGGGGTSSSPSRGTFSESSGGAASPLNLSSGACNNHPHAMSAMPWK